MRLNLTDYERAIKDNSDGIDIGIWTDNSDHMQFKCNKCGQMMDMRTQPFINSDDIAEGGTIYLNIFCRFCNKLHSRKIYFGVDADSIKSQVEYKPPFVSHWAKKEGGEK